MSLYPCLFVSKPACRQSRNGLPPFPRIQLNNPSAQTTVLPAHHHPAHRQRTFLLLLSLLLPALTTGCTPDQVAIPSQTPVVSAQAAEQTPTPDTSSAPDISSIEVPEPFPETAAAEPAAPESPQLMSQASMTAAVANAPATEQGFNQGPLRLGNQTQHPLRIAFLAQSQTQGQTPEPVSTEAQPEATTADAQTNGAETANPGQDPFHWDFAPEEGGRDGLLLALPEGDLMLQNGDVVVAFAQDGSQRYWGPYIVGQTSLPHWNGDRQEWQLLVQP